MAEISKWSVSEDNGAAVVNWKSYPQYYIMGFSVLLVGIVGIFMLGSICAVRQSP